MHNSNSANLSNTQINSYAYQAASQQDVIEESGFGIEDKMSAPRMLFGALGPDAARLVTERMVQIRKDPDEMKIAKQDFFALQERTSDLKED